jgi:hypothetical protein
MGWSLLSVASAILAPLSLAGFVDSLTARVKLYPDKLVVVSNLRRREYSRTMFVRATYGKGVPVALQYTTGEWLQLPNSIGGGLGMANTLRAWLQGGGHAA